MRVGGLVLAAGVLLAGPAAAAAPVGPSSASADINNVRIACTGDTVSGTVKVTTAESISVLAVLFAQYDSRTFVRTDRFVMFEARPGTTNYVFTLNTAGLPLTASDYKVHLSAGTSTATSNAVPTRLCAPAAVVPEVPAAALVPLSLAVTAALVLALRRRQLVGEA
jgi:hypothetical protein